MEAAPVSRRRFLALLMLGLGAAATAPLAGCAREGSPTPLPQTAAFTAWGQTAPTFAEMTAPYARLGD